MNLPFKLLMLGSMYSIQDEDKFDENSISMDQYVTSCN